MVEGTELADLYSCRDRSLGARIGRWAGRRRDRCALELGARNGQGLVASWLAPGRSGLCLWRPDHRLAITSNAIEMALAIAGRLTAGLLARMSHRRWQAPAGRCPHQSPPKGTLSCCMVAPRRRCQPAQPWANSERSTTPSESAYLRQAGGKLEPISRAATPPSRGSASRACDAGRSFRGWQSGFEPAGNVLTAVCGGFCCCAGEHTFASRLGVSMGVAGKRAGQPAHYTRHQPDGRLSGKPEKPSRGLRSISGVLNTVTAR